MTNRWTLFCSKSACVITLCSCLWNHLSLLCNVHLRVKSWWLTISKRCHLAFSITWYPKTGNQSASCPWNHWLVGSWIAELVSSSWMTGMKMALLLCSGFPVSSSLRLSLRELCRTTLVQTRLLLTNWPSTSTWRTIASGLMSQRNPKLVASFTVCIWKAASGMMKIIFLLSLTPSVCSLTYLWFTYSQLRIVWLL